MTDVCCDLDGVLVEFEGGFYDHFNKPFEWYKDEADAWNLIMEHGSHWENLPLMEDAMILWHYIKKYNPIIITGCPKIGFDIAAEGKRKWVAKHLGSQVKVITCLSKDKPLHMPRKDSVLIDDRIRNIRQWKEAGGVGVLHVDAITSISELESNGW